MSVSKGWRTLYWVLCCPCLAVAQVGEEVSTREVCSFFGESLPASVVSFDSDAEADSVIERIVAASGLAKNFVVKAAGVPNAAAVVQNGTRYILYNQHFMQSTREEVGNRWAPISIMAHEVGHHLNGHTLDGGGSRPPTELQADYYSGFILQKLGASLNDARAAMMKLGSPQASPTHPAVHDRLAAIANGWTKACESDQACNRGPRSEEGEKRPRKRADPDGGEPVGRAWPEQGRHPVPDVNRTPRGIPSGFGMQPCGCWGFNPRPQVPEPRCQSGFVRPNPCMGLCPGGGSPYAFVCQ